MTHFPENKPLPITAGRSTTPRLASARKRVEVNSPPSETEADEALIAAATHVAKHAYAPYSKFTVGSAVRTQTGSVFVGCNVENVSYPVGVCAERNAIAAAVAAEGPAMQIDAIAVVARSAGADAPCSPCGACRQAIGEFGAAARVHYRGADLAFRCDPIGTLLPGAFSFKVGI